LRSSTTFLVAALSIAALAEGRIDSETAVYAERSPAA
jgi:hypothetical protein